jgi:hypothetical protein
VDRWISSKQLGPTRRDQSTAWALKGTTRGGQNRQPLAQTELLGVLLLGLAGNDQGQPAARAGGTAMLRGCARIPGVWHSQHGFVRDVIRLCGGWQVGWFAVRRFALKGTARAQANFSTFSDFPLAIGLCHDFSDLQQWYRGLNHLLLQITESSHRNLVGCFDKSPFCTRVPLTKQDGGWSFALLVGLRILAVKGVVVRVVSSSLCLRQDVPITVSGFYYLMIAP